MNNGVNMDSDQKFWLGIWGMVIFSLLIWVTNITSNSYENEREAIKVCATNGGVWGEYINTGSMPSSRCVTKEFAK